MSQKRNLTEGNILEKIIKLAIPIMGTAFLQMTYNMTDMLWIGRGVGSSAVAAVGAAGFYIWLAAGIILLSQIGAGVGVAQSIGREDIKTAKSFARNAIQLNFFIALLYGVILILFKNPLIGFFRLGDVNVTNMAKDYLTIIALGTVFSFANPVFTGIFNGGGESKHPFLINAIGLLTNMILDPVLILGIGPFPALGVKGAAIATITAQLIVTIIFILYIKNKSSYFSGFKFYIMPQWNYIKRIVKMGYPVALQNAMFTIFAMIIARIIALWGPVPIAVQKIGSEIESISWMTSNGFATALSAFVGQNYGAGKWKRIYKGYFTSLGIMSGIGILASLILIFCGRPIFTLFFPNEEETIFQGIIYLKILGLSQLFMCIEITTAGAFNGLGKTLPPSLIGIIFTGLRIPAALILSKPEILGLKGVWWSISVSSIFKGIVLLAWFLWLVYRQPEIRERLRSRFIARQTEG
ncbi:MATE family efflux transporter [Maledivibacter halophilus]|uniref:Probable multidrug resistance protein NorM n=1 Tax=Maledivibacter halophilus TaxID=36842 RepID=A0A1T5JB14_9FIRM|nr:MATE family efflux transporter [Maledivibacter halophilus]SKC48482.1 putative efflux protein, MATE family [Maledivibacter halophilus]